MDDWKTTVLTLGAALAGGAGYKFFDLFTKRGADVVKAVAKERRIKEVALSGNASDDIATVTAWALNEFRVAQREASDNRAEMHRLEIENATLKEAFEKMKTAYADQTRINTDLVREVTSLIEQTKSLSAQLAAERMAHAKTAVEHEGAKYRIHGLNKTIRQMETFLAELEAKAEHKEAH